VKKSIPVSYIVLSIQWYFNGAKRYGMEQDLIFLTDEFYKISFKSHLMNRMDIFLFGLKQIRTMLVE